MDRNTVIGLVMIGLILSVFTIVNQPTNEELKKQEQQVALNEKKEAAAKEKAAEKNKTVVDSKLNTVETVYETTIKEVEKIKYVTKTEWQTEYKDVFVYTNTECSLPDSGIKLLDDYSAKLNATRKVQ